MSPLVRGVISQVEFGAAIRSAQAACVYVWAAHSLIIPATSCGHTLAGSFNPWAYAAAASPYVFAAARTSSGMGVPKALSFLYVARAAVSGALAALLGHVNSM